LSFFFFSFFQISQIPKSRNVVAVTVTVTVAVRSSLFQTLIAFAIVNNFYLLDKVINVILATYLSVQSKCNLVSLVCTIDLELCVSLYGTINSQYPVSLFSERYWIRRVSVRNFLLLRNQGMVLSKKKSQ